MLGLPNILLIDDNPVSIKLLQKSFSDSATLQLLEQVSELTEAISCNRPDIILINADLHGVSIATTCALFKNDPAHCTIKLIAFSQQLDSHKELNFLEAGVDDTFQISPNKALIKHKVLRHIDSQIESNPLYKANNILNRFYESTYCSESLSDCLSECLKALQCMQLDAALHVCDHPELTCSSYGYVNEYEKALMVHSEFINAPEGSGRFSCGDDTLSVLIQNLPNQKHPQFDSLIQWVKKIFSAMSQKTKYLLAKTRKKTDGKQESDTNIPHTSSGAQRLHYHLEKALGEMEQSCEKEINRSIGRIDEFGTWSLTPVQKRHVLILKENLLQLKESLLTNCLEIESRYLQFITERRAKTRLNIGW